MSVSRETSERLETYKSLIRLWNPKINLIAPGTVSDIDGRHIDDCGQLTVISPRPVAGRWADLGSGGGLPGLVVAIAFADTDAEFTLIESDQRKAAFLRTVVRETGLQNTTILNKRIEAVDPLNAAVISARALAPLPTLMAYLDQHLASDGRAFLMKGQQWQSEVGEARKAWRFDMTVHPSVTQDGAAILEVSGVSHGAE